MRGGSKAGGGGVKAVEWGMVDRIRVFAREQDGAALTEYVVLLGILIVGVVGAVLAFSSALSTAWTGWADWLGSENRAPTT